MPMYFGVGNLTDFLFKGWDTHDAGAVVGICIGVGAIAIILEIVKVFRVYLMKKARKNPLTSDQTEEVINERSPILRPLLIPPSIKAIKRRKICFHLVQSGLHFLQVVIGYLVMLAVMSYNVYVFVSVIIGSALAYFTLGIIRNNLQVENTRYESREDRERMNGDGEDLDEGEGHGETEVKHRIPHENEPVYS